MSSAHTTRAEARSGGPFIPPIGVLVNASQVLTFSGSRELPSSCSRDLEGLHRWSAEQGLRQLWLTPESRHALGLPEALERRRPESSPFLHSGALRTPRTQEFLTPWLSVWSREHYLEVAVPEWDRRSPWRSLLDFPPALLGELGDFTDATGGWLWRRSGAITSDSWLREHWGRSGLLRATEYPECAADPNVEPDAFEVRSPAEGELRARWCHAFDANALYLAAASSLALPVGECESAGAPPSRGPQGVPIPRSTPGYWLTGGEWLTTPSAAYAEWTVASAGHYWQESHQFLTPWYKALREARKRLLSFGPSAALEAVKQVYREGIGRLGSTRRTSSEDFLLQPYWRHAVMGSARTRLLRRVGSLRQAPVVVCDVDTLYFLTSSSSPVTFAQRIGLPLGTDLGAFKHKGTLPGSVARQILAECESGRVPESLFRAMREAQT